MKLIDVVLSMILLSLCTKYFADLSISTYERYTKLIENKKEFTEIKKEVMRFYYVVNSDHIENSNHKKKYTIISKNNKTIYSLPITINNKKITVLQGENQ